MPTAIASSASSRVSAGPVVMSRVPRRTFIATSPSAAPPPAFASHSGAEATPTSTTVTEAPICRANALTTAPPATMFATIWAVTSCGHGVTP